MVSSELCRSGHVSAIAETTTRDSAPWLGEHRHGSATADDSYVKCDSIITMPPGPFGEGIIQRIQQAARVDPGSTAVRNGVESITFLQLERRSNRLARAIGNMVMPDHFDVVLLCCDRHVIDRTVGLLAAGKVNRYAIHIGQRAWKPDLLRRALDCHPHAVVLACQEGTDAWLASGLTGQILGDGSLVPWWAMAEIRQPFSSTGTPIAGDLTGVRVASLDSNLQLIEKTGEVRDVLLSRPSGAGEECNAQPF
jgi:hypothetical protein